MSDHSTIDRDGAPKSVSLSDSPEELLLQKQKTSQSLPFLEASPSTMTALAELPMANLFEKLSLALADGQVLPPLADIAELTVADDLVAKLDDFQLPPLVGLPDLVIEETSIDESDEPATAKPSSRKKKRTDGDGALSAILKTDVSKSESTIVEAEIGRLIETLGYAFAAQFLEKQNALYLKLLPPNVTKELAPYLGETNASGAGNNITTSLSVEPDLIGEDRPDEEELLFTLGILLKRCARDFIINYVAVKDYLSTAKPIDKLVQTTSLPKGDKDIDPKDTLVPIVQATSRDFTQLRTAPESSEILPVISVSDIEVGDAERAGLIDDQTVQTGEPAPISPGILTTPASIDKLAEQIIRQESGSIGSFDREKEIIGDSDSGVENEAGRAEPPLQMFETEVSKITSDIPPRVTGLQNNTKPNDGGAIDGVTPVLPSGFVPRGNLEIMPGARIVSKPKKSASTRLAEIIENSKRDLDEQSDIATDSTINEKERVALAAAIERSRKEKEDFFVGNYVLGHHSLRGILGQMLSRPLNYGATDSILSEHYLGELDLLANGKTIFTYIEKDAGLLFGEYAENGFGMLSYLRSGKIDYTYIGSDIQARALQSLVSDYHFGPGRFATPAMDWWSKMPPVYVDIGNIHAPDFSNGGANRYNYGIPASIRHNNPGASYPAPWMRLYGMNGVDTIGGGHLIANFPTMLHGLAANLHLMMKGYAGMSIQHFIHKWSGGHDSGAYANYMAKALGLPPDTIMTKEMLQNPHLLLKWVKAQMRWEGGEKAAPYIAQIGLDTVAGAIALYQEKNGLRPTVATVAALSVDPIPAPRINPVESVVPVSDTVTPVRPYEEEHETHPADCPACRAASAAKFEPTISAQDMVFLGDTLAAGMAGVMPKSRNLGIDMEGSADILRKIREHPEMFKDKYVVLSTGASTDRQVIEQNVRDQIAALMQAGAKNIAIVGVGPGPNGEYDVLKINDTLRQLAMTAGFQFIEPDHSKMDAGGLRMASDSAYQALASLAVKMLSAPPPTGDVKGVYLQTLTTADGRTVQIPTQGQERLTGLNYDVAIRVAAVIEDMRALGYQPVVGHDGGMRTEAQQAEKVSLGYSKTMHSNHLVGGALDLIDPRLGWDIPQGHPYWDALGAAAKRHGLGWGGDFSGFFDGAHVEMKHPTGPVMTVAVSVAVTDNKALAGTGASVTGTQPATGTGNRAQPEARVASASVPFTP